MGSIDSVETLDKGSDGLGWYGPHETSSHYSEKEAIYTYELFISGIVHLIFLDSSRAQVTKTVGRETVDKEGLLYDQEIAVCNSHDFHFSELFYLWITGDTYPWNWAPFTILSTASVVWGFWPLRGQGSRSSS